MNRYDFSVILLAAGMSKRMGKGNKLLLPINAVPLVRHMANLYVNLFRSVTVVTGYESEKVTKALEGLKVSIAHNPGYASGQQSSVRTGMGQVSLDGEGVLIALSDQPLLRTKDLVGLVSYFLQNSRDKILIPYFGEVRGNPVLFPTPVIKEMQISNVALGCRRFIDLNPHLTTRYVAPNSHFTTDVDTTKDVDAISVFHSKEDRKIKWI